MQYTMTLVFSNSIHHIYFSLLKLKPVFQLSSVAKRKLGLCPFYSRIPGPGWR